MACMYVLINIEKEKELFSGSFRIESPSTLTNNKMLKPAKVGEGEC